MKMKILAIFLLIIINNILFNQTLNLKIAICTMAKKENLYIKEFVDYYLHLGIDHIFIYDDNDINSEKISDILDKSYKDNVTIFDNIKDRIKNQSMAYTSCYNNNKNKFDWFFMNDIDEYLVIKKDTLKNYLSNYKFKKCDFIKIHWIQPTDNNLLHYDNRTLIERFKGPYLKDTHIKTLVRGNIEGLHYDIHSPSSSPKRNISCSNIGKKYKYNKILFNDVFEINYDKAFIIHFKYKSTEEYINKYKRGYSNWFNSKFLSMRIEEYFKDNEVTLEKVEYMEKELKLNLSEYKRLILMNKRNKKSKNFLNDFEIEFI